MTRIEEEIRTKLVKVHYMHLDIKEALLARRQEADKISRFRELLKDRDIPMEDRWELLKVAPEGWAKRITANPSTENICGEAMYDLPIQRMAIVNVVEFFEVILSPKGLYDEKDWTIDQERYDKEKEFFLQRAAFEFVNDW